MSGFGPYRGAPRRQVWGLTCDEAASALEWAFRITGFRITSGRVVAVDIPADAATPILEPLRRASRSLGVT